MHWAVFLKLFAYFFSLKWAYCQKLHVSRKKKMCEKFVESKNKILKRFLEFQIDSTNKRTHKMNKKHLQTTISFTHCLCLYFVYRIKFHGININLMMLMKNSRACFVGADAIVVFIQRNILHTYDLIMLLFIYTQNIIKTMKNGKILKSTHTHTHSTMCQAYEIHDFRYQYYIN